MPDYQMLFERLRDVVLSAQKELAQRNYGNAERILSDALQRGIALCDAPNEKPAEHSSLAYARRHGL